MSRGNPEVEAMLAAGIPYCSMPEALMRFFMRDRRRAVVVGTHGKTTTSAMLAWVLRETARRPELHDRRRQRATSRTTSASDAGPWFVVEGDEYDTAFFDKGPKFLHYDPDALLLNAIEFDHADIYRDLDHVKSAFRDAARAPAGRRRSSRRAPTFPKCAPWSRRAGARPSSSATAADATWRA